MTWLNNNVVVKNIYYMMAYAFSSLHMKEYEDVETEKFDNIYELFAAILVHGLRYQIKKGLYKEYVSANEDLYTIRGKINMPQTIRNDLMRSKRINCDFDEYSENNILNQIVKTTAMLLIRHDEVELDTKDDLKKCMLYFSGVDAVDPRTIVWSSIRFQRNNESYRLLIGVCQMILQGMLMSEATGGLMKLRAFEDTQSMARLYEKFLLEYYRREWPQFTVSDSWIDWAVKEGESTDLLPGMHSDIMLIYKKRCLILDAKLYSESLIKSFIGNKETLRSSHLYQIFAYVKNKEAEKNKHWDSVSGILVYAKTEQELQPDNVYHISGNAIGAKNLDLNNDFVNIKLSLDKIAMDFIQGIY